MQAESGRRVLVVDDSKFVRTTFRNILSSAFTVLEEGSPQSVTAFEVVAVAPPETPPAAMPVVVDRAPVSSNAPPARRGAGTAARRRSPRS